jgi:hypothetical protein
MFEQLKSTSNQISLVKGNTFDFQRDDNMLLLELRVEDGFPRKKFEKYFYDTLVESKDKFKHLRFITSFDERVGHGSFLQFKVNKYRIFLPTSLVEALIDYLNGCKTNRISDLAFRKSWESCSLEDLSVALSEDGLHVVSQAYKFLGVYNKWMSQSQLNLESFILRSIGFPDYVEARNAIGFLNHSDFVSGLKIRGDIFKKGIDLGFFDSHPSDKNVIKLKKPKELSDELSEFIAKS